MENKCTTGEHCGHEAATFTDDELMDRLKLRAAGCRQKSMTARLDAVISLVEALLSRGYDRSQAREVLIEVGWHFTPDSFDSALSRVRKRRPRSSASNGAQLMSSAADKGAAQEGNSPLNQTSGELPRSMAEIYAARASLCRPPPRQR